MKNNILIFLEEYKRLDELCKQVLDSDKGVTEYISEMEKDDSREMVPMWYDDYKMLKRVRWIRNQLVHSPGSFDENLFAQEDILWIQNFRVRIMACDDPFALLRKRNMERLEGYYTGKETVIRESTEEYTDEYETESGGFGQFMLLLVVILVVVFGTAIAVGCFLGML